MFCDIYCYEDFFLVSVGIVLIIILLIIHHYIIVNVSKHVCMLQKGKVFVFRMYECMVFMLRKYINFFFFQTTDSVFFSIKSGVSRFFVFSGVRVAKFCV